MMSRSSLFRNKDGSNSNQQSRKQNRNQKAQPSSKRSKTNNRYLIRAYTTRQDHTDSPNNKETPHVHVQLQTAARVVTSKDTVNVATIVDEERQMDFEGLDAKMQHKTDPHSEAEQT